jgi:hypothetical protein
MPERSAGSGKLRTLVVAVVGWCALAVALLPGLQVVDEHYQTHAVGAAVVAEVTWTVGAAVLGILLATIARRSWWAWLSVHLGTPLVLLLGAAIAENIRPAAQFNSVDSYGVGVVTAVLFTFWGYAIVAVGAITGSALAWIRRHRQRARADVPRE